MRLAGLATAAPGPKLKFMEPEYKLKVYDILQNPTPFGRTSEDGSPSAETIRQLINDNWDKYEKIIISFDNIVRMTRTFVDEAFAKLLEDHTLEEFNQKIYFPDAKESTVKEINAAFKLRLKIIKARIERENEL